ncbi:agmatinase, partial [Candidatus Micrarchaeota archaeon]|nr:agmatinase [Candidatus Micrarchaeota archaeon]
TEGILALGKKPVIFGGEHSITSGAVAAIKDSLPKGSFSVLQIDAHSDLRDSYESTKHSHASAMRRVRDHVSTVVQVGIRSMCDEEAEYISNEKISNQIFYAHNLNENRKEGKLNSKDVSAMVSQLTENVFVTVDIDGFDPSIVPGTGTPEPGGLYWEDVLGIMRELSQNRNVVGFDIVEVLPSPPLRTSEFVAAKLAYKMMGLFWSK